MKQTAFCSAVHLTLQWFSDDRFRQPTWGFLLVGSIATAFVSCTVLSCSSLCSSPAPLSSQLCRMALYGQHQKCAHRITLHTLALYLGLRPSRRLCRSYSNLGFWLACLWAGLLEMTRIIFMIFFGKKNTRALKQKKNNRLDFGLMWFWPVRSDRENSKVCTFWV